MQTARPAIHDVEAWNDAFADEHDIDAYYTRSSPLIRGIEQRRLATIRRLADVRCGQRVLEVGCGGGHVLRLFPQADLTGLDVSGRMIAKAERNLKGYSVSLLKGELDGLDVPECAFDVVICSEVLEHVVDPDEVLDGIRRRLKPGGRAIITFPNDHLVHCLKSVIRNSGLTVLPFFRRISWGGDQYHLHVWSVEGMRGLLSAHMRIKRACFAPGRFLPIRCCFDCRRSD